jgi:hypothetical protein
MFASDGGVVTFTRDTDNGFQEWSGGGYHSFISALNAMSRQPARGVPWTACWGNHTRACGCYDFTGCYPFIPAAMGGLPAQPCPDVRDNGYRGGLGLIRINFIERV